MRKRWYFAFFVGSGFCSLVYEVVWLRLAMAEFGVTTPMVSIVLSSFMAGLGLGSWWSGSFVRRLRGSVATSALRFYALMELLIGISALLVPRQLAWGHALLQGMGKTVTWQSSAYYVVSGGWVALTLVPWCACMGATFPLVMAVIQETEGAEAGRSFSYLYVANVMGALLGTLASAFVLIELLGFRGTLLITSAVNGILAASAFALSFARAISAPPSGPQELEEKTHTKLYGLPASAALWLLFTTGITSMAMEVVWIRQFTPYLGNVVYAFAMILGVYLVATFHGSRDYRSWARSHRPEESAAKWIVLGSLSLIPLFFADPLLLPPKGGFGLGVARVAAGIVPFCALVGFLTPMLVDYWSSGDPDRAGSAYAVNVVGSIVGPILAGFWLLPWLGERRALIALSLPLFGIGVLAALRGTPRVTAQPRTRLKARLSYGLAATATLLLVSLSRGYEARFPERVVRRDFTGTVIATGEGYRKRLLVNGIGMTELTPITKFMAHLPLAFVRRPPREGLVVCLGMGTTFRSMLSWRINATAVELVPSVPAVFVYFHPDAPRLLSLPLARVVVDDGRRFLDGSTDSYDVITVDPPPPPGASGSSLLYSREFYAIAKKHLGPGGILQVWLPKYGADAATVSSAVKALRQSFPYMRIFRASASGFLPDRTEAGFHFLASAEPIPVTPSSVLAARLPPSAAADFVEWGPRSTAEEQFSDVLRRECSIESLIAQDSHVPPLEDDQPINEYYLLREAFHYYR